MADCNIGGAFVGILAVGAGTAKADLAVLADAGDFGLAVAKDDAVAGKRIDARAKGLGDEEKRSWVGDVQCVLQTSDGE